MEYNMVKIHVFLAQGGLMPYYILFSYPMPYKYDVLLALSLSICWRYFWILLLTLGS